MVSGLEFTSTCRRGNDRSSPGPLNGALPHGMRIRSVLFISAHASAVAHWHSTPQLRCRGVPRRSVAADSIVIAVKAVVIRSDHGDCAGEVGGAVTASAGAVHVARDRYALSGIVGVA